MSENRVKCEEFHNLAVEFLSLMYEKGRREKLHALNALNELDYKSQIVSNSKDAVLLIHRICSTLPPNDEELTQKCCCLISNLIFSQKVKLEGRSLRDVVQWSISYLNNCTHIDSTIDILAALECLLRGNVDQLEEFIPALIGPNGCLLKLVQNASDEKVVLFSLKCMRTLTFVNEQNATNLSDKSIDVVVSCSDIFISHLSAKKSSGVDEIIHCKILLSCLRGLQNTVNLDSDVLESRVGLALGIAKSYMVYFSNNIEWVEPKKLTPSAFPLPVQEREEQFSKKGSKMNKKRKGRLSGTPKRDSAKKGEGEHLNERQREYVAAAAAFNNEAVIPDWYKTSDSELSDTENEKVVRVEIIQGKVRKSALELLYHMFKAIDKPIAFSYWFSFIPDNPSTNAPFYLTNCLLKDPTPAGRMAAMNALLSLIGNVQSYLSLAESKENTSTFTSFSMNLGLSLHELHRALCLALAETSIPVLSQALKCIACLVVATPYHRLKAGLLTKIIRNMRTFIRHKDVTIQVAALNILGCVLVVENPVPEIELALLKNVKIEATPKNNSSLNESDASDCDEECLYDASSGDEKSAVAVPWLLQRCLQNLNTNTPNVAPMPLRLESLQVIGSMCKNYFSGFIAPHIQLILKALEMSLSDKAPGLRLHAGRTTEAVGQAMESQLSSPDTAKKIALSQAVTFWLTLLNEHLVNLLQDESNPSLRAIACDCFKSIGTDVFEMLPKDKQIIILTSVLSKCKDGESVVRGSAVRTLAASLMHPSLRDDSGFIIDAAEAVMCNLRDDNFVVRVKASWSLGNLSDLLLLIRDDSVRSDIPNDLIMRLMTEAIQMSNDSHKIQANIVRALGNFIGIYDEQMASDEKYRSIGRQAIEVLVKQARGVANMKVKWNACYAMGKIFANDSLLLATTSCQGEVFDTLAHLVADFRNFKVRINAAAALAVPSQREHYANHFETVFKALLTGLDNAQNMESFTEYKHRDNLVDQICSTIVHMLSLITVNDISPVCEIVSCYMDTAKSQMMRVQERLVPEKMVNFLKSIEHLRQLEKTPSLTQHLKESLTLLTNLFLEK